MSVADGQRANAQTFNDAFLSRTTDSDTVAIIGLNHPSSGGLIANAQQKINDNTAEIVSNDADIATLFSTKQDITEKGVANGYAPLDGSAKIDPIYLPTDIVNIKGNWDASTNTPTLADGVGDPGDVYIVSVAGTQDLGSGNITFAVGDWAFYTTGNVWIKVINSNTVTSVNGQTGVVSLGADDITDIDTTTVAPVIGQALIWDGSNWVPGTGSGGSGVGGISYVKNPGGEIDAADHTAYQDAAQDTPEDGDGGSPTTTVGRSTVATDILRGDASLVILKPASNVQGEGVHIGLDPIDPRDKFQRLQVSFDYKHPNPGGNPYIDGDYRVFIYDVDNAALIGQVENDDGGDILRHEGDGATFLGYFQATDSLNYRLLIHITTTDATSTALSYDNVKLGPVEGNLFTNISNWEEFPLGMNGIGSATFTGNIFGRRVGDSFEVNFDIQFTAAGSGGSGVEIQLPSDVVIDGSKVPTLGSLDFQGFSTVYRLGNATNYDSIGLIAYQPSNTIRTVNINTGSFLTGADISLNDEYSGTITFPVVGWEAANVVSNTELTQKTVNISGAGNGGTSITANVTDIDFTEIRDSHDAWNGTQFIAPSSGRYTFKGSVNISAPNTGALYGYLNGSQSSLAHFTGASASTKTFIWEGVLNKGQSWSLRSDTTTTLVNSATLHYLEATSHPNFAIYGVINPNSEYREVIIDSRPQTSTANTYVSSTESLTLSPGRWEIGYHVLLRMNNGTGGAIGGVVNARLFDDTNSLAVPDTGSTLYHQLVAAEEHASTASNIQEVVISEETDYKMQVATSATNVSVILEDSDFTGGITGNETAPKIWARKIS